MPISPGKIYTILKNSTAITDLNSLCPANSSVPITASGIIPINQEDVANIPPIALTIPDFEGEAILRIFANSTESEIGCYSAVVTNGATFSHPDAVGSVLGIFAFIAMLASFATAIYGEAVPTMRLHYAHSLSVGVVFAVFQHIFYTGALSMNWPSVLVAWWSNFAWAGGMIRTDTMQRSIDRLIGNNLGNTSSVGAAATGTANEDLGGGYDISQIYKRALGFGVKRASSFTANHPRMRDIASEIYKRDYSLVLKRDITRKTALNALMRRQEQLADVSDGFKWYGHPVAAGLPLPGNFSGFAGTLGQEEVRASNAFMTGFLWFIIILVLVVAATMALKWLLEGLVRVKVLKQDRLAFFRQHWLGYSANVALRTCFIAWFMIMFLTIFQFTYDSSGGVKAVAAIVFLVFLVGLPGVAAYACWYKVQRDNGRNERTTFESKKLFGKIPWFGVKKTNHDVVRQSEQEQQQPTADPDDKTQSTPFWKRMNSHYNMTTGGEERTNVHDDEDYTKKFGWLAARFRRTRWWFFVFWLAYEFVRACFYGGASGQPLTQVFGLLVVEILAFAFVIWARPFEGMRLNILVVYCLGFSKVTSVALSAAFDIRFNLERITTTVIGIVIIVIQGILVIITMIAIVVSVISSYMSVSRNREEFRPRKWHGLREKYFNHLDRAVNDVPREPKSKPVPEPEPEEKDPYFEVRGIRRLGKIEDDDPDPVNIDDSQSRLPGQSVTDNTESSFPLMGGGPAGTASPARRSRATSAASLSQSNLPYGARPHRPSWSQRDFSTYSHNADAENSFVPVDMSQSMLEDDTVSPPRSGAPSRTPSRGPPQLRSHVSNESLGVGGDISSRDVIGKVPAPSMRPRAGTWNSRHSARNSINAGEHFFDAPESSLSASNVGSQWGSGARMPLTPAQEAEEYIPRGSGSNEHSANRH